MTQKTSKRTHTTKTSASGPSLHGIFRRWVVAGLLAIAFYLMGALITALYVKTSTTGSIDQTGGLVTSALFALALISAFWWLIESASGIMLYISRHSKPARKKKK